jgi:type IX secretion system PorP/SprF family membrane protein
MLLALLCQSLLAHPLQAQQDFHTTQFLFNKLALNPGYAGADHVLSVTALYRHQWAGLEGAPQTANLSVHSPIARNRMGLGLLAYDDRIGINHHLGVFGVYNYKIPLGSSVLSLGLQAGLVNLRSERDQTNPLQAGDPVFSSGVNGLYPNAGVGVYWYMPNRAFAGFSIPRLIQNPVDELVPGAEEQARLYRHSYAMAGYAFPISRGFLLRASGLLKIAGPAAVGAPIDAEFNVSALLAERIWLGVGVRANDAVSGMVEVLLSDQWTLGYAYDIGTSALAAYHNGSHEAMLRYQFYYQPKGVASPRRIRYF